jgi:hypothetical protein
MRNEPPLSAKAQVALVLNLVCWVVLSLTYRWLSSPVELTDRIET